MTQQVLSSAGAIKESNSFGNAGYGTSLPGSPTDGMEYVYTDSVSAPTFQWRFRYNAGSGNTDKWEFVGGAPRRGTDVDTDQNTTSTSYAALATAGPSVIVPLAGVYDVMLGARINQGVSNQTSYMSYDIGGTGAVDADAITVAVGTALNTRHQSFLTRRKTLTAVTLTAKYKVTSTGSGDFANRWIAILPVRVS